jgi:elongation factor Ts
MAEVSAAAVKSLREKTGLPMMECKKALASSGGDEEAAIRWLREQGIKTQETRLGRETGAGRIAVYVDLAKKVGAMIEVQCESAPVAGSPDFKQFTGDLARQLALGPGAASGDDLLKQPSPSAAGKTLANVKDDLFNRMREVFNIGRLARIDGPCGGYAHHDGSIAALVEIEGGNAEVAKDVAMHVVAQNPSAVSKENLDPALVQKEREILSEAARKEGKPENIIQKMIEGRLRNFYAERVLLEQPFVKDDKKSVGQYAKENGMQVKHFIRWQMGKTTEA